MLSLNQKTVVEPRMDSNGHESQTDGSGRLVHCRAFPCRLLIKGRWYPTHGPEAVPPRIPPS